MKRYVIKVIDSKGKEKYLTNGKWFDTMFSEDISEAKFFFKEKDATKKLKFIYENDSFYNYRAYLDGEDKVYCTKGEILAVDISVKSYYICESMDFEKMAMEDGTVTNEREIQLVVKPVISIGINGVLPTNI